MAAIKRKKTRRKKHHYITGVHKSPKCFNGSFKYKSSWEDCIATYFDQNPDVASYSYEQVVIQYTSNIRSAKLRKYYPDFLVEYVDGHRTLFEVKRQDKLNNSVVLKKAMAAKIWAKNQSVKTDYQFLTEAFIAPLLKKLQKLQKKIKK